MFAKTFVVAIILCACYLGMIQAQLPPPVTSVLGAATPVLGGAGAGLATGSLLTQGLNTAGNPGGIINGTPGLLPSALG
nr:uncharacterized protein LOC108134149 [Drosophila bipectinata]